MTIAEIHSKFLILYDAISNASAPGLEPEEIDALLNTAMDDVVMGFVREGQFDNIRELYEINGYGLSPCTIEWLGDYAYQINDFNDDFVRLVSAEVRVTRSAIVSMTAKTVRCEEVTKAQAERFANTATNQPIIIYPKIFFHYNGGAATPITPVVLTDKYTTIVNGDISTPGNEDMPVPNYQGIKMVYIRRPVRMSLDDGVTCELHPVLHDMVISLAVNTAMKVTDMTRQGFSGKMPQQPKEEQG